MGTEPDDRELLFLISFLEEAYFVEDVTTHIEEQFKLTCLQQSLIGGSQKK
jgi:hypothetical protein